MKLHLGRGRAERGCGETVDLKVMDISPEPRFALKDILQHHQGRLAKIFLCLFTLRMILGD